MPGLGQGREFHGTFYCHCDIADTVAVGRGYFKSGLPAVWQAGLG